MRRIWNETKTVALAAGIPVFGMLLPASCGNATEIAGPENGRETVQFSFTMETPGVDEVEYSPEGKGKIQQQQKGRATQEAEEQAINRLHIYDFVVDTDTLLDGVYTLQKAESASPTPKPGYFSTDGNGKTNACLAIVSPMGSRHLFAFVANETETVHPTDMDGLRKTCASIRPAGGEASDLLVRNGPVMTGRTSVITLDDASLAASVGLQRIIARIDVRNNTSSEWNMTLKGISIENCPAQGTFFERDSHGESAAPLTGFVAMQHNSAVTFGGNTPAEYKKVIYMYECPATSTQVPTLVISYVLNGWETIARVPMETAGKRMDIRRNRVYTLVIEESGKAAVDYRMEEE